jgi:hypothetical protein
LGRDTLNLSGAEMQKKKARIAGSERRELARGRWVGAKIPVDEVG